MMHFQYSAAAEYKDGSPKKRADSVSHLFCSRPTGASCLEIKSGGTLQGKHPSVNASEHRKLFTIGKSEARGLKAEYAARHAVKKRRNGKNKKKAAMARPLKISESRSTRLAL